MYVLEQSLTLDIADVPNVSAPVVPVKSKTTPYILALPARLNMFSVAKDKRMVGWLIPNKLTSSGTVILFSVRSVDSDKGTFLANASVIDANFSTGILPFISKAATNPLAKVASPDRAE